MNGSNRGGARPGAGRPRLKTVKAPDRPDTRYRLVGIPEHVWQEFCEAAAVSGIEESDYGKLADLAMFEGLDRFIKTLVRKAKKNEQQ
jgi:hypothetical protein